jgi:hypothetical protein
MATPAQIAANRRNALKSTGPRTAVGKAASSRNALRHGLAARAAVVLGEDPADLARFRAELVAALAPSDGREEVLAEVAAEAAWRLRRVWRAEAALFNRHGRSAPSCLRELLTLQRYEVAANRRFHRAVAMLEQRRTRARLSGSRKWPVLPRTNRPIESSCADLFRASTHSFSAKENVDARDKRGHDDSGVSETERTRSGAVSKCKPDSSGTSRRMTTIGRLSTAGDLLALSRDAAAPRLAARNHGFCRRNPIWGPGAGAQPTGVFCTLPIRASRLAFAEKQLISWKTVLKRHRVKQNPFEFASIWPSWVERRAPPPQLQQIALQ